MEQVLNTQSAQETLDLAMRLADHLSGPDIVFLTGQLGTGKTVFAKGLYLGIGGPDPDQVVSPSYTMVNIYEDCGRPYYHVDLYRLEKQSQLLAMEYEDFLLLNSGLTVVEWPEFARDLVDEQEFLDVFLDAGRGPDDRTIRLSAAGERYEAIVEGMSG